MTDVPVAQQQTAAELAEGMNAIKWAIGGSQINPLDKQEARDALAALAARVETAERERDEWKQEAHLSKWPKEAAQEFFRLKADYPALEARNHQLEQALRPFEEASRFYVGDTDNEYPFRVPGNALRALRAVLAGGEPHHETGSQ